MLAIAVNIYYSKNMNKTKGVNKMSYITRAQFKKQNKNLKTVSYCMCIVLGITLFFIVNISILLIEARKEVKAWRDQDTRNFIQVKELKETIRQLEKENKILEDMRPVHGVVSEY